MLSLHFAAFSPSARTFSLCFVCLQAREARPRPQSPLETPPKCLVARTQHETHKHDTKHTQTQHETRKRNTNTHKHDTATRKHDTNTQTRHKTRTNTTHTHTHTHTHARARARHTADLSAVGPGAHLSTAETESHRAKRRPKGPRHHVFPLFIFSSFLCVFIFSVFSSFHVVFFPPRIPPAAGGGAVGQTRGGPYRLLPGGDVTIAGGPQSRYLDS